MNPETRPSSPQYLSKTLQGIACAALLAMSAVGLMFVVAIFLVPSRGDAADEALGRLVGFATVPVLGASLVGGLAWPWREHRRVAVVCTLGSYGIASALCFLALVAGSITAAQARHEVTVADRAAPTTEVIDGQPWLVQHATGFEMPVPAGLALVPNDPVVAQLLSQDPALADGMTAWRWANADQSSQIIVTLAFERLTTEADAQSFFDGMVRGAIGSMPPALGEIAQQRRGPLEHVLRAQGPAASMVLRFFSYTHGQSRVFVSITAVDATLQQLEPLVNAARGHE